jgi:hypothetical protein
MRLRLIREKVQSGVASFRDNHPRLLEIDVNERTITSHLSDILRGKFPGYDVDHEYNRHGVEVKKMTSGKLLIPDIVVHKEEIDVKNLLAIEVKKGQKPDEDDIDKLRELTSATGGYRYAYGLFLGLENETQVEKWWKNGAAMTEEELNRELEPDSH